MAQPRPNIARALPTWLVAVGSAVIGLHLFAVGVLVVAAPSGQWSTPFGPSMAEPPPFAQAVGNVTTMYYLRPLQMTYNYHFNENRVGDPAVWFEVRLKDEKGDELKTLKFPDPKANFWVRHRQQLLAQGLGGDQPIQARPGEVIPAPKHKVGMVDIWKSDAPNGKLLHIEKVPAHLIPRNEPVMGPSSWSQLLARSYVRHLCREHGAAKGELIRHSRDAIMPAALIVGDQMPPGTYDELISNFGEFNRE